MLQDTEREREEEGKAERHFHRFGEQQGPYMEELAKAAGVEGAPSWMSQLYREAVFMVFTNSAGFKELEIVKTDDGGYTFGEAKVVTSKL